MWDPESDNYVEWTFRDGVSNTPVTGASVTVTVLRNGEATTMTSVPVPEVTPAGTYRVRVARASSVANGIVEGDTVTEVVRAVAASGIEHTARRIRPVRRTLVQA